MPSSPIVKTLLFSTYLACINNSVKTSLFRASWALVNGKKQNLVKDGQLSCAFFVSSLLLIFKLIKNQHTTVSGTVMDLQKSGWKKIARPKIGCIIVWEKENYGAGEHAHIGFYIGNNKAISNSSKKRHPLRHHWTYQGKRQVQLLLWHPKLNHERL